MKFHFHANQSHFHKNGFALRLALKQRHKGTRKWPITFLGHASFLVSLTRREFLKPDIAVAYQSVCNKSSPVTTFLFGDELPKHIKDIGEVNKIAKKTLVRSSLVRRASDYKSSSNNFKYSQRGRKPFLGSRGHRDHFSEGRPAVRSHPPHSSKELSVMKNHCI